METCYVSDVLGCCMTSLTYDTPPYTYHCMLSIYVSTDINARLIVNPHMHTVTLKRLVSLVKNLLVSTVMRHKLIQLIIYSFTINAYTLADRFIAQERPGSAWTVEVSKKISVMLTSMEASYLVCVYV